jgi:VCBS repeat-containing protein
MLFRGSRGETRALRWGSLLAVAVLVGALLAGLPSTARAVEAGNSHITGTVVSDGFTPLFNVTVVAYRSDGIGGWAPAGGAYSLADGTYDIPGLLAGTYRVSFHATQGDYPLKWNAEKSSLWSADDIVVGPATTTSGVGANLAAGHISGRLENGAGTGIPGVDVSAYESDGYGGWTLVGDAVSDMNGDYDVGALRTGTHRVMFSTSADYLGVCYGGGDSVYSPLAADVDVTAGTTRAGVGAVLLSAGHVGGRVTNDGSTGIRNIQVHLYQQDGGSLYDRGATYTAADGSYTFGGLGTGTYHAQFADPSGRYPGEYYSDRADIGTASDISVTAGSTSHANAELTAGRIRGTVTAFGGGGVEGIEVRAYRMSGEGVLQQWIGNYTAADGTYDLGGLPALGVGEVFHVVFLDVDGSWHGGHYPTEYYLNDTTLAAADDVVVAPGNTVSGIDAVLTAGMLEGTVTSDGSTPIPGISVYAIAGDGSIAAWKQTGPDGTYSFPGLAPGDYRVGFEDAEKRFRDEYSGDASSLASASPVGVEYADTTVVDAQLAELGHITGRVTSDGSHGVADVDVSAWTPDGSSGWRVFSASTAADGSYDIHGLDAAAYRVRFWPPSNEFGTEWYSHAADRDSAQTVTVTAGAVAGGIDATLTELGRVAGTVTDGSNGIGSVSVTAYTLGGAFAGGAVSEEDGSYRIKGLRTGSYRLEFSDTSYWNGAQFLTEWHSDAPDQASATPISVTNGATQTVDAVLAREAHVRGTVRSPEGNGIGGVSVSLMYPPGPKFMWPAKYDVTASDGSYDFGLLAADTYRLSYYDPSGTYFSEYYDDSPGYAGSKDVTVALGATRSAVDATLTTGGHITGTVTSDGAAAIQDVIVYAYKRLPSGAWNQVASGITGANGVYDLSRLETGSYRIKFYDINQVRGTEFYDDASGPGTGKDVAVTRGSTTPGIDAVLGLAGSIEGTVTSRAGSPVSGVWAYAYVPDGSGGWDAVQGAATAANGSYRIAGLRAGDYRVKFLEKAPYLAECWDDAIDLDSAANVTVATATATTRISAVLDPPSHITGTVTSDGVSGIAGIWVSAEKPDGAGGWTLDRYVATSSDGTYDIPGLAPGLYRVSFAGDGTYLGEWYDDASKSASATLVAVLRGADSTGIDAILATRGHIAGRVASDGGSGLEGIDVYAKVRNQLGWWENAGYSSTDASGTYDISGLLPGDYRVQFDDPSGTYKGEWFDDRATVDAAADVAVAAGSTAGGIDATLTAPASISGTITAGGDGLEGATVRAYLPDGSGGWSLTSDTLTGSDGAYVLAGLDPGTYRVEFVGRDGYLGEWFDDAIGADSASPIVVSGGTTTTGISAILTRSGGIGGTVTDSGSAGIGGVGVSIFSQDASGTWNQVGYASTDEAGSYEIAGLRPGDYRVAFSGTGAYVGEYWDNRTEFDLSDPVTVVGGLVTGSVDAVLRGAGSISGTVTSDGTSGIGLVYAAVYRPDGDGWSFAGGDSTDASGAYTVTGLQAGTYRLQFTAPDGYLDECWNDAPALESATDIIVVAGDDTGGIDAILSTPAHITGTVTSDGGAGIENVMVVAYAPNGGGGWLPAGYANTGAGGEYDIGGLTQGSYRLLFYDSTATYLAEYYADASTLESATPVTVSRGERANGCDAVLERTGAIAGTVTGETSTGVAGASVSVWARTPGGGWTWADQEMTAADGSFEVAGLRAGTYRVGFSHPDYVGEYWDGARDLSSAADVVVSGGSVTAGIDATLVAGGVISGAVTSSDTSGIADVVVSVYRSGSAGAWAWGGYAVTGADGTYSVTGLEAGAYKVQFDAGGTGFSSEWYRDAAWRSLAETVTVTAGHTSGNVDARLTPSGRIAGTVRTDGAEGIENIRVVVYAPDEQAKWAEVASCYTDKDGAYVTGGLSAGPHRLRFIDDTGARAPQYYAGKPDVVSADSVPVIGGETTGGIDVVMGASGHITGSVTESGSAGIPDVMVFALAPDGQGGWEWGAPATTGSDGSYDICGLAAGTYRVFFWDPAGLRGAEFYDGRNSPVGAASVSVAAGFETGGVDATLEPGGHIAGRVSTGATPVKDIYVYACVPDDLGGWLVIGSAQTGADGAYDIGALATGTYRVEFVDESGAHATAYYDGASDMASARAVDVISGDTVGGIELDYACGAANSPPVSADDTATVPEDTTLTVSAHDGVLSNDSDAEDDTLTAELAVTTAHGSLALSADGSYVYRPDADFEGVDVFTYRAFDGAAYSGLATATITVTHVPETPTTLARTSAAAPTIAVGSAHTFAGTLAASGTPLASRSVVLESSSNGSSFVATGRSFATDATGRFAFSVNPTSKTWYRARFAGDPAFAGSECVAVVSVKAWVGNPVAPTTMTRTKSYAVYGYLKPRHASGSSPVRIYKYRLVSGKWKGFGYVSAKVANYSSYSKYSCSMKLTTAGKWRLSAYAPADSGHVAMWSPSYASVTVK